MNAAAPQDAPLSNDMEGYHFSDTSPKMHAQNAGNGAAMPAERRNRKRKRKNCGGGCGPDASPWPCVDGRPRALGVLETAISRASAPTRSRMAAAQQFQRAPARSHRHPAAGHRVSRCRGPLHPVEREIREIYEKSADQFKPGARLEDALRVGVARGDYPDAAGRERNGSPNVWAKLHHPGLRHEQMLSDGRCILIEDRLTGRRRRDRAARRHHRAEAARSCSACCSTATRCR